jgi:hypothetical protein
VRVRRWKTSLVCILPAARTLLRHAVWICDWAQGEFHLLVLPHPLLHSLAMASDDLVETHEPSSLSWLSDAADDTGNSMVRFSDAMLDSVNCGGFEYVMLCLFLSSLSQHAYYQRCCF